MTNTSSKAEKLKINFLHYGTVIGINRS